MIIEGILGNSAKKYAAKAGLTELEWKNAIKLKGTDLGWVILFIGGAIGAGIVFLPVQVGLVGLWIYIIGSIVGYPILYYQQRLFLNVLATADKCDDFSDAISSYKGPNWGFAIGILFFLQVIILLFLYSTALNNDSASFLLTFNVTETSLAVNPFYGLILLAVLTLIASQGETLLMKLSSFMVITKIVVVLVLGLIMIQYWNFSYIGAFPEISYFIKQFIVILPLVTMSIAFFSNLSPAIVAYRSQCDNKLVAHYKALRAMNFAYFTLVLIVVFYTISFNLGISHEQAVQAFEQNISSLAIAARNMDGMLVKIFGLILNIFAVVTAFFAIFLAFRDSSTGLVVNLMQRFTSEDKINRKQIRRFVSVFCVVVCWGVIALNIPIVHLAALLGPLMGLIGCIMPVYMIATQDSLKKHRGIGAVAVGLIGLLLVLSPFISLS